jgi:hypothetical protein
MNRAEALALGPVRARAATACHAGHPFDEANTLWSRVSKGGLRRKCRTCHRLRMQARRGSRPRKEKPVQEAKPPVQKVKPAVEYRGTKPPRTHCGKGHPLVGDNLRLTQHSNGYTERRCVTCRTADSRRTTERRRRERDAARAARGLPPTNRGRSANGRQITWSSEVEVGDDGRVYAVAIPLEYERANEDSFRLAATRALRRWMTAHGYELPRAGWEPWGEPELDWATDLPMTFGIRTIDPLPEVAERAA